MNTIQKNTALVLSLLVIISSSSSLLLHGCGDNKEAKASIPAAASKAHMSQEQATKVVKKAVQKTFDTDPGLKEYELKVEQVHLFPQTTNSYKGLIVVWYQGTLENILVKVNVDGDKAMWQIPPESFEFLSVEDSEEE